MFPYGQVVAKDSKIKNTLVNFFFFTFYSKLPAECIVVHVSTHVVS